VAILRGGVIGPYLVAVLLLIREHGLHHRTGLRFGGFDTVQFDGVHFIYPPAIRACGRDQRRQHDIEA
jgi:hypothetical protein